ncbi:hypothetical protein J3R83DRAFT_10217 [Lanmaoa asiatica]|nr:hypothetical protein J3R83DRAFT_10217 [Lanmaoa asiatica]
MIASVPAFLDKLAHHQPRFVCFVGVIIWEIVRNSLVKLLRQGKVRRTEKGKGREKNQMGLQTYKLVYGNTRSRFRGRGFIAPTIDTHARVTYSRLTSGDIAFRRAVHIRAGRAIPGLCRFSLPSHFIMNTFSQLSDKIALFTELHRLVKMASSEIDTSEMESVVWHSASS